MHIARTNDATDQAGIVFKVNSVTALRLAETSAPGTRRSTRLRANDRLSRPAEYRMTKPERVVTGAASVLIMLALLEAFHRDKFQSVVIAGLGLIYMTVRSVGLGLMMILQQTGRIADAEFARIRHLLNDPTSDKDATLHTALATMHVDNVKAIINMVFLAINALICVAVLLGAVPK